MAPARAKIILREQRLLLPLTPLVALLAGGGLAAAGALCDGGGEACAAQAGDVDTVELLQRERERRSQQQNLKVGDTDCASCSTCIADPDSPQAVKDEECAPCALNGQSWWPCNLEGLCQCAGGPAPAPVPSPSPAPEPEAPTSAPSPKAPTPAPSPGSTCSEFGPTCEFEPGAGISSWFTKDLFDQMFPNICNSACHGCELLTYECLISATLLYPEFAQSADDEDNKRELAAWLGEMSQETNGGGCRLSDELPDGSCSCGPMWCDDSPNGGCAAWGLCFVEEQNPGSDYCQQSTYYPCQPGRVYSGRGPKQLSWNYNYGQFSESFCGDKMTLLSNPDWVASNPTLAWASSMWFWFTGGACLPETGEICKPNCHEVFLGTKKMCPKDEAAGRKYGLGWVTNIINGGLECGGLGEGKCDSRVQSRVRFYEHFCNILGIDPLKAGWTEDENLYCADQKNYKQVPPENC